MKIKNLISLLKAWDINKVTIMMKLKYYINIKVNNLLFKNNYQNDDFFIYLFIN